MCVILLYTNALQMHKQRVSVLCVLVSRRKTPQKNNHQNRNAHQKALKGEEKGDDVFHYHLRWCLNKKKTYSLQKALFWHLFGDLRTNNFSPPE